MLHIWKKALLQSLWSVEVLPKGDSTGMAVGVMLFQVQRFFGDFFESGRILGGDTRYYFAGTYQIENYVLVAQMDVVCYAGDPDLTFGAVDKVCLEITATLEPDVDRDVLMLSALPVYGASEPIDLRLTRRMKLD